jgi:hypothetical protein
MQCSLKYTSTVVVYDVRRGVMRDLRVSKLKKQKSMLFSIIISFKHDDARVALRLRERHRKIRKSWFRTYRIPYLA